MAKVKFTADFGGRKKGTTWLDCPDTLASRLVNKRKVAVFIEDSVKDTKNANSLKELQTQFNEKEAELATANDALEASKTELQGVTQERDQLTTDLETTRTELTETKGELETARTELATANQALEDANTELDKVKAELEKLKGEKKK